MLQIGAAQRAELEALFGAPQDVVACRCVPHAYAVKLDRITVVRAVNTIRTLNDPAWNAALPYIRALLLGL